jgi:hypothetical protein
MELQKCLHCGGEPYIDSDALGEHIRCIDCGAQTTGETVEEAAQKWNRRADGWVSVKERLPETARKFYLCAMKNGDVRIVWYEHYANGNEWMRSPMATESNVTHWQPLPEPPEVPDAARREV